MTTARGTRWVKCIGSECMFMFPHLCFQRCDPPPSGRRPVARAWWFLIRSPAAGTPVKTILWKSFHPHLRINTTVRCHVTLLGDMALTIHFLRIYTRPTLGRCSEYRQGRRAISTPAHALFRLDASFHIGALRNMPCCGGHHMLLLLQ